jgi:hypothetical protein
MFKVGDKVILPYGDYYGLHKGEKGIIVNDRVQVNVYAVRLKDGTHVCVLEELLKYDHSAI